MPKDTETEKLWLEFKNRLLGFIRKRVNDEGDAEDILQDVFVRIHANSQELNKISSVSGWVYQVTRNVITDYYRSLAASSRSLKNIARENQSAEITTVLPQSAPSGGEHSNGKGLAGCMRFLIRQLPQHYEEAIALVELGGLSQKEAAEKAGISLSGMKSRVQRGRAELRGVLLSCCKVELDGRQGVVEFEPKDCPCDDCS